MTFFTPLHRPLSKSLPVSQPGSRASECTNISRCWSVDAVHPSRQAILRTYAELGNHSRGQPRALMAATWLKRMPVLAGITALMGGLWYTQEHSSRIKSTTATGGQTAAEGMGPAAADTVQDQPPTTAAAVAESQSSDSIAGNGGSATGGNPRKLLLHTGASMKPHPDKVAKGGEDAFFIADSKIAMGVADGVGGWSDIGVDAGEYSRLLMEKARQAAKTTTPSSNAPQSILETAYRQTRVRGSSTACVLVLDGDELYASNLGDSGFLVVRGGNIIFQSPQQQHGFNYPYQLGNAGSGAVSDPPSAAQAFSIKVQHGDIVVVGTDGLLDNVFPDEAAAIATVAQRKGESPRVAAEALSTFARMRAADRQVMSPFAYAAQSVGLYYLGGKMDDITVLVSYVAPAEGPFVKPSEEADDKPTAKL